VTRLDVWLAEHGLAESREKAQALVMAGRVRVDGAPASKPGAQVRPTASVVVDPGPAHVGRGALKLAGALDAFGLDPAGRVAVDVGASTGGFTETLLDRGAARVYAVDVGRGQLHEKLRADPRVVVRERTNARSLGPAVVPESCALAVVDVSFISVAKILPALLGILSPGADVLVLVKPQFEVGRERVGKGGVVRSADDRRAALLAIGEFARSELGLSVLGYAPSGLPGPAGNRETFVWLAEAGRGGALEELEAAARRAEP
jgi:23S rRNA (cytidine1920-2'-O)/16S rRNA (cytidine1409-2'-O)-methyltransferase